MDVEISLVVKSKIFIAEVVAEVIIEVVVVLDVVEVVELGV